MLSPLCSNIQKVSNLALKKLLNNTFDNTQFSVFTDYSNVYSELVVSLQYITIHFTSYPRQSYCPTCACFLQSF